MRELVTIVTFHGVQFIYRFTPASVEMLGVRTILPLPRCLLLERTALQIPFDPLFLSMWSVASFQFIGNSESHSVALCRSVVPELIPSMCSVPRLLPLLVRSESLILQSVLMLSTAHAKDSSAMVAPGSYLSLLCLKGIAVGSCCPLAYWVK